MPKMKTHRGAAKRIKRSGSGKLRRHRAYASHLLGHKNAKRKRRLRSATEIAPSDVKRIGRLLPN
jgi:large subunit ribosomal protein L35